MEFLQSENAELHELLQNLRSRPRPEADEILNRLRSDPSVQVAALLTFIKEGDLLAESFARSGTLYDVNLPQTRYPVQTELAGRYPNVYFSELPNWRSTRHDFISAILYQTFGNGADLIWSSDKPRSGSYGYPSLALSNAQSSPAQVREPTVSSATIDFTRFPDGRMAQATCKPWTNVIHNDKLFQRLLIVYFTWLHPSFCVFDQNLFLEDLIAQNTESRFCSPMLVNTILALSYVCRSYRCEWKP